MHKDYFLVPTFLLFVVGTVIIITLIILNVPEEIMVNAILVFGNLTALIVLILGLIYIITMDNGD